MTAEVNITKILVDSIDLDVRGFFCDNIKKQINCKSAGHVPLKNLCQFLKIKNKPGSILKNIDKRLACPVPIVRNY
jgi:hypothetical protein